MGASYAAKPVGPPTPKEFFIEAVSGLLNCDRSGNSSFSTVYVDSSRPLPANSGRSSTARQTAQVHRRRSIRRSSTRSLALTEEGQRLFERAQRILAEVDEADPKKSGPGLIDRAVGCTRGAAPWGRPKSPAPLAQVPGFERKSDLRRVAKISTVITELRLVTIRAIRKDGLLDQRYS
jgi:hypothetical protein